MYRTPSATIRVLLADERDVVQLGFRELLADEPWVEGLLAARTPYEARELESRIRDACVANCVRLRSIRGVE
jgi:hypothetical protein